MMLAAVPMICIQHDRTHTKKPGGSFIDTKCPAPDGQYMCRQVRDSVKVVCT